MGRFRSFFDDAWFVVLIMAAAMASAALETGAVLDAFQAGDRQRATTVTPASALRSAAAASSVDGALLSVAGPRSGPSAR